MSNKYAQLQAFSLSGSGCTLGATSITLSSMFQIDGTTLVTMADFGAKGFATIEPGSGTKEEQISFTNIVQNSNGTATLTGVSTVSFVSPYTETSGTAQSHPGGVALVISNTSGFYNTFANKGDDETITGKYTFPGGGNASAPVSGTVYAAPTNDLEYASKKYVDTIAIAGAPNATTVIQGLVQLPTQAQVDSKTSTGSTGATLAVTPNTQRSTLLSDYVLDTGAADAYVITPSPAISAYTAGQQFTFKAAHTNTTTSTLNVNSLGVKTIKKLDGSSNLIAGDLVIGEIIQVQYDGTNFQMINVPTSALLPSVSGNAGKFLTTDGTSASFGYPYDYQVFTSGGTWTKPSNLVGTEMVLVQMWGAGGAGGGMSSQSGTAGAGGGGAYLEAKFRASDLTGTVSVTVAGTTTGGSGDGSAGNNTTFGSYATAYGGGGGSSASGGTVFGAGGGGGVLSAGSSAAATATNAVGGSPAGGASATDSSFGGGGGGSGKSAYGGGGGAKSATGGSSVYGGGGGAAWNGATGVGGTSVFGGAGGTAAANSAGGNGVAPGGGGGGAHSAGTATLAGGSGARGEVRVWTFK